MKSVIVAGSRKFSDDITSVVDLLGKAGVQAFTTVQTTQREDTLETEKDALLEAFLRIEKSDILYVVAKDGYVGKTVAMEIAYAFAREKKIIASETISELSSQALVSAIFSPEELIEYCKH